MKNKINNFIFRLFPFGFGLIITTLTFVFLLYPQEQNILDGFFNNFSLESKQYLLIIALFTFVAAIYIYLKKSYYKKISQKTSTNIDDLHDNYCILGIIITLLFNITLLFGTIVLKGSILLENILFGFLMANTFVLIYQYSNIWEYELGGKRFRPTSSIFRNFYCLSTIEETKDTCYNEDIRNQKPFRSIINLLRVFSIFLLGLALYYKFTGDIPLDFLQALGLAGGGLLFIFKDSVTVYFKKIHTLYTIIQRGTLSIGDWVEVKDNNLSGIVKEINLDSIILKNFYNSETIIPLDEFSSNTYTNQNTMINSGGRRIKEKVLFDINSIKIICKKDIEGFPEKFKSIHQHFKNKQEEIEKILDESICDTEGRQLTNIGLFRNYTLNYLEELADIQNFSYKLKSYTYIKNHLLKTGINLDTLDSKSFLEIKKSFLINQDEDLEENFKIEKLEENIKAYIYNRIKWIFEKYELKQEIDNSNILQENLKEELLEMKEKKLLKFNDGEELSRTIITAWRKGRVNQDLTNYDHKKLGKNVIAFNSNQHNFQINYDFFSFLSLAINHNNADKLENVFQEFLFQKRDYLNYINLKNIEQIDCKKLPNEIRKKYFFSQKNSDATIILPITDEDTLGDTLKEYTNKANYKDSLYKEFIDYFCFLYKQREYITQDKHLPYEWKFLEKNSKFYSELAKHIILQEHEKAMKVFNKDYQKHKMLCEILSDMSDCAHYHFINNSVVFQSEKTCSDCDIVCKFKSHWNISESQDKNDNQLFSYISKNDDGYKFNFLYPIDSTYSKPKIQKEAMKYVTIGKPTENGIPVEISAFTTSTNKIDYENVKSDILEHLFIVAKEFNLTYFQNPNE